jgi:carbon-monoxide dehydrogenase medium subunit
MKPVPFTYHAPDTIAEAVRLLDSLDNARVLAGGQSLVPMLNLRVAAPDHLIDLGRIGELRGIAEQDGRLVIGAMTTQRDVERSALVRRRCPLLAEAIDHVGHQQTRNRGTLGGSLCHLDPGAELPVAALALGAEITAVGPHGERRIPFDEFPVGYLSSTLEPNEIATRIGFPAARAGSGWAFLEFNRRPADFAVVSVAVRLALSGDRVDDVAVAVGGISFAPLRLAEAEAALRERPWSDAQLDAAAALAATTPCEGDEIYPPDYRQHLVGVLVRRALLRAGERAREAAHA